MKNKITNVVKLILLYDHNVVAKEVITLKVIAYIRGLFWKYNVFSRIKRDYIVVDK
jgi:hypothetical protein